MKKAVIETGGKQYVVFEGETLKVELIKADSKTVDFVPLLVINDKEVLVGSPTLTQSKVTAEIVDADSQADKVTSIRYKAKKRVHTVRGHRQHQTTLKVTKIT
ncbi:MAG: 50S ribosomal protein L21 [Candidatus Saccharimonadales bacterium]